MKAIAATPAISMDRAMADSSDHGVFRRRGNRSPQKTHQLNKRERLPIPQGRRPLQMCGSHFRGQVECNDRKSDENDEAEDIGDDERQYAVEDGRNLHVLDYAFYYEDVHADRRMDEAELDRHDNDDPEPD